METLLWGLVCLFGLAALVDKVMTEEAVLAWRERTRELRGRVEQIDVDAATAAANEWFIGLFDAIYDARFWSLRRFGRSALSSVLALAVITLLLGWEETAFGALVEEGDWVIWMLIGTLVILINLIGDYFSLQETRWVLGRSQRSPGMRTLILWLIFDTLATALIFAAAYLIFLAGLFILGVFLVGIAAVVGDAGDVGVRFFSIVFDRDKLLPMFLTTFFTSALWISYVVSALGVRALRRNSKVLRTVLGTIAESRAPARATAGFLAGFLALGYGLVAAVAWTVG